MVEVGSLASSTVLHVVVSLEPRDPAALAKFTLDVSTPGSPLYRHYLKKGQFAGRFGPTATAIAAVEHSLTSEGLHPGTISADHLLIPVTATEGEFSKAFSIGIERVRAGDRIAFANTSAPLFAGAIKHDVVGVLGLDDLYPLQHSSLPAPAGRRALHAAGGSPSARAPRQALAGPSPCTKATDAGEDDGGYTANQFASAYDLSSLYSSGDEGKGVTIGIYELESNLTTDIAAYQSCYGTTATVNYIKTDGGSGSGAGSGEAALDIEDAIGLAPEATIDVYQGENTASGAIDNYDTIVDDDVAKVVTTSWGLCEYLQSASTLDTESDIFQEAADDGQTVFSATGDDGSEDCYDSSGVSDDVGDELFVDDPSSQWYVTGVGGTSMTSDVTPTQTTWNEGTPGDDGAGAGGGGQSNYWFMPSWQSGAPSSLHVIESDYSDASYCDNDDGYCRETPDVSADANPYYGMVFYYDGAWSTIGGTSIAAPLWASIASLIDADPSCGGSDVGFFNPSLYEAAAASYSTTFHDVSTSSGRTGDNDFLDDNDGYFPAGPEYDMATGLGTPNAAGLASYLCQAEEVPAAPSSVTASGGSDTTAGDGQIALSWTAPTDNGSQITAYTITPTSSCTGCTGLSTTGATKTTVGGLVPGDSYSFEVTATNGIGTGPDGVSNTEEAPPTAPNPPSGVSAAAGPNNVPGDGEIKVSWTAPFANGSNVTGFQVGCTSGCTTVGASASSTSTTLTNLTPGAAYTVTVQAENAVGESSAGSATGDAPDTAPGTPTAVKVTQVSGEPVGVGELGVSWTAPAQSNGSVITGYTLVPSPACGGCSGLTSSTTSTEVTGLTPGGSYTFTVAATNAVGTGGATTASTGVEALPTAPDAPSPVEASAVPATAR